MIEIVLVGLLLMVAAASPPATRRRAPQRRTKRKWVTWPVTSIISLTTLAAATALEANLLDNVDEAHFYSARGSWSIRDLTPGEGPIQVGFNDGVYSAAEIVEAVDASPTSRSDRINIERAGRAVRNVGAFPGEVSQEVLNDGRMVYTKVLMNMSGSSVLNIYAINRSAAALTTGAVVRFEGLLTGYWL